MERLQDVEILGYDNENETDIWGRSVKHLIVSSKRKKNVTFTDSIVTCLPGALFQDKNVKAVHFVKCQIQEKDWKEGPFSQSQLFEDLAQGNVKDISISECNLRTLPTGLFNINTLEVICIKNVPGFRRKPKQTNNHVFPLPIGLIIQEKIPPRPRLKELSLVDCGLKTFPGGLSALISLQYLNVSGNPEITELPQFLQSFECLHHLDASNCGLVEFPKVVCDIPSLIHLNLAENNKIKSVPNSLQQLVRLQYLLLSSCGLTSFPEVILTLTGLFQLHLSRNKHIRIIPLGIKNLVYLEHLSIAQCGLREYPEVLSLLPRLTHLDIKGNHFNSSCSPDLTSLGFLEHLEMSDCPFQGLLTTQQVFTNLLTRVQHMSLQRQQSIEILQGLILARCDITTIPDQIRYLTNLKTLNLFANKALRSLPKSMKYLHWLEELELAGCGFQAYPDVISELINLRHLNLSGNEGIQFLPRSLESLQKLEHMNISGCGFTEFPDVICHLAALLCLNVSSNNVSFLPREIKLLKNLRKLIAENCHLQSVPNVLDHMPDLETIRLEGNKLTSLDWNVRQCSALRYFSAKGCRIDHCPEFIPVLTNLFCLYLKGNPIQVLPNKLGYLRKVRVLDLGSCSLEEFPEIIIQLSSLTSLFMPENKKITTLPDSLSQLYQLHHLDVAKCRLDHFPEAILRLKFLRCLYVNGNIYMRELPEGLRNLKELVHVDASHCGINEFPEFLLEHREKGCNYNCFGNKVHILNETSVNKMLEMRLNMAKPASTFSFDFSLLKVPPAGVFKSGLESCRQYYRERKLHGSLKYDLQSVILLGNTMAGKTSLIKTIAHNDKYLTPQSDRTAVVESEVIRAESIQLNVADFGGHHIYELIYPIFLKAGNQLIVVCVDLSQYSKRKHDDMVTKWIHTALCSMESGRIVIAATKADLCQFETKYVNWDHYRNWESHSKLEQERYKLQGGRLADNHLYKKLHTLQNCIYQWKEKELTFIQKMYNRAETEETKMSLQTKYDFLNDQQFTIVPTSSRDFRYKGMRGITSAIYEYASQNACVLPNNWKPLIEELERRADGEKPWVSIVDLKKAHSRLNVENCLQVLSNCGMILWFQNIDALKNIVFHNVRKVIEAFKNIFHHDLFTRLQTANTYLEEEGDALNYSLIEYHLRDFQQDGLLSDKLLQLAFSRKSGCLEKGNKELFLSLFMDLNLCFKVEKGRDMTHVQYFFPWFAQKGGGDEFLQNNWPKAIPTDEMQLEVQYKFCHRLPPTAYERLTVEVQSQLMPQADCRNFWKDMVFFQYDGVKVIIKRFPGEENPHIQLKLRAKMNNLYKLYVLCYDLCFDMDTILLTCPGVVTDSYLVCPHCLILCTPAPKLWRLKEVAMADPPIDRRWVSCEMPYRTNEAVAFPRHKKTGAAKVEEIPAAMVILRIIGNFLPPISSKY